MMLSKMKEKRYLYQESSTTGLCFQNDTLHERYTIYPSCVPFKIKAVYVNNKYVKKEMLKVKDNNIICEYYAFRCLNTNIRIYYYITVPNKEDV